MDCRVPDWHVFSRPLSDLKWNALTNLFNRNVAALRAISSTPSPNRGSLSEHSSSDWLAPSSIASSSQFPSSEILSAPSDMPIDTFTIIYKDGDEGSIRGISREVAMDMSAYLKKELERHVLQKDVSIDLRPFDLNEGALWVIVRWMIEAHRESPTPAIVLDVLMDYMDGESMENILDLYKTLDKLEVVPGADTILKACLIQELHSTPLTAPRMELIYMSFPLAKYKDNKGRRIDMVPPMLHALCRSRYDGVQQCTDDENREIAVLRRKRIGLHRAIRRYWGEYYIARRGGADVEKVFADMLDTVGLRCEEGLEAVAAAAGDAVKAEAGPSGTHE